MLTQEQKDLDEVVQGMSPIELRDVVEYARTIVEQRVTAPSLLYDPDDDPTEEDLRAISHEGMKRFAEEHPDDDWGYDAMDFPPLMILGRLTDRDWQEVQARLRLALAVN